MTKCDRQIIIFLHLIEYRDKLSLYLFTGSITLESYKNDPDFCIFSFFETNNAST